MGKNEILKAIKANKPSELPLPGVMKSSGEISGLSGLFQERLIAAGGAAVVVTDHKEVIEVIRENFPDTDQIIGDLEEINTLDLNQVKDPHELSSVDLAVFKGARGIAENGAVWLQDSTTIHRVAPFICTHLVLVISASEILPDMHEGYKENQHAQYGHGVFISGPSKTADIEQSLVIGAHGPKSLTVIIVEK